MICNGTETGGPSLANSFNNSFLAHSQSIGSIDALKFILPSGHGSVFLSPVDSQEVTTIFRSLKNSTSLDGDDLQILPVNILSTSLQPH